MLVSVCIPTFNGQKFLQEALDSVKVQTYENIELIINDDGSTDGTSDIIFNFIKDVSFPVKIFSHKPSGIGANWNNCLKNANGDYIKFLFQDDILFPTCVEELVGVMKQHRDIGLVACKRKLVVDGEVNEEYKRWIRNFEDLQTGLKLSKENLYFLDKKFFKNKEFRTFPENKIGEPSTILFKRNILIRTGYFRENMKQVLDLEFYYRVLKYYKIGILNKELAAFRLHAGQTTVKNREQYNQDPELLKRILYEDFFWYLNFPMQKKFFKRYNWLGKFLLKLYSY